MRIIPRLAPLLLAGSLISPASAATGTHLAGSTLYPRLIRLHHARKHLKNTLLAKTGNKLFRSSDEGRSFTYLTTVPTASLEQGSPVPAQDATDKERCCSTIYELPRKIGHLKAGTLLYSASFFSGGVPAIEIYTSSDQGAHWQFLSTPLKAGDEHHGLWEPEFSIARNRSLVLFFSDETDPCCSQKLVSMHTSDGRRWSPREDVVASRTSRLASASPETISNTAPTSSAGTTGSPGGTSSSPEKDRPGMAVISILPNQTYFMSYEICGPVAHCQVYTRTSIDGLHFGDPASFGTKVVSAAGQYLAHAPAHIFNPVTGEITLVGQVLYEADGSVSAQNGRLLFTTASLDGTGSWQTIAAPVEIPSAYNNYCPNYSSALMQTSNGLLELASDYDAAHLCTSYFASRPFTNFTP